MLVNNNILSEAIPNLVRADFPPENKANISCVDKTRVNTIAQKPPVILILQILYSSGHLLVLKKVSLHIMLAVSNGKVFT